METLEEFYEEFNQHIYTSADVSENFKESQFFEKSMEYLIEDGIIEDYTYTPYQKIGMKIDGYNFIDKDPEEGERQR